MKKYPLGLYVAAVMVVLVIVNYFAWLIRGNSSLGSIGIFSIGFLVGMLAMYIAVHLYRWK